MQYRMEHDAAVECFLGLLALVAGLLDESGHPVPGVSQAALAVVSLVSWARKSHLVAVPPLVQAWRLFVCHRGTRLARAWKHSPARRARFRL